MTPKRKISQALFNARVKHVLKEAQTKTNSSEHAAAYADKHNKAYLFVGGAKKRINYQLHMLCDEHNTHVLTLEKLEDLELRMISEDAFVESAWGKMFPGVEMSDDSEEARKFAHAFSGYIATSRIIGRL